MHARVLECISRRRFAFVSAFHLSLFLCVSFRRHRLESSFFSLGALLFSSSCVSDRRYHFLHFLLIFLVCIRFDPRCVSFSFDSISFIVFHSPPLRLCSRYVHLCRFVCLVSARLHHCVFVAIIHFHFSCIFILHFDLISFSVCPRLVFPRHLRACISLLTSLSSLVLPRRPHFRLSFSAHHFLHFASLFSFCVSSSPLRERGTSRCVPLSFSFCLVSLFSSVRFAVF